MNCSRVLLSWVIGIMFVLYPSMGWAHNPIPHEDMLASLQGISAMSVSVEVGFSRGGPTQVALQAVAENLLQKGGVTVVPHSDEKGTSLSPRLHIEIAVVKRKALFYTYFIRESLIQKVHLSNENSLLLHAPTWMNSLIGEGTVEFIDKDLRKLVQAFLVDFHKANRGN